MKKCCLLFMIIVIAEVQNLREFSWNTLKICFYIFTSLLHASCLPSFSQFFSGKFLPRIIHTQLPLKQNGSATVTIPSSLDNMEQFTVCARFNTYYFVDIYADIVYGQSSSIQVVLYSVIQ